MSEDIDNYHQTAGSIAARQYRALNAYTKQAVATFLLILAVMITGAFSYSLWVNRHDIDTSTMPVIVLRGLLFYGGSDLRNSVNV